MKMIWFFIILSLILIPIAINESSALQQIAGKIIVNIKPGETKTFKWGLISDSDSNITLGISATGKGAHFLSFPKTFQLAPHQAGQVEFTVTIPYDHPGNVELDPMLYATQFGEQGGATIINIQMLKIPSIIIAQNDNPQFRSNTAYDQPEQTTNNVTSSNPVTNIQNGKGLTVVQNTAQKATQNQPYGGRCLIATAAFGSDLSPQVQFLRGFRDNHILATESGSSFMNVFNAWYYSFSPYVADYERQQPWLQQIVKTSIYPLLGILTLSEKGFSTVQGDYGSVVAGSIASSMIGAVYFWPFALSIKQVRKNRLNYKIMAYVIGGVFVSIIGSILVENQYALMITTSLFVLTLLSVSAILVAKLITSAKKEFSKTIKNV